VLYPFWGRALYLDDHSSNVDVQGNVFIGASHASVFVHSGSNNTLENNVLFVDAAGTSSSVTPSLASLLHPHLRLYYTLTLRLYYTRTLRLYYTLTLRLYYTLTLRLYYTLTLRLYYTLTLRLYFLSHLLHSYLYPQRSHSSSRPSRLFLGRWSVISSAAMHSSRGHSIPAPPPSILSGPL
jgi:parallel beta-helix repeat protein